MDDIEEENVISTFISSHFERRIKILNFEQIALIIIREAAKKFYFLNGQLPPPPLNGQAIKRRTFFAYSQRIYLFTQSLKVNTLVGLELLVLVFVI